MPAYYSGLDLGQSADYSALVILEHGLVPDPDRSGMKLNRWDVRHIQRWHLGTPYPTVVADLVTLFDRSPICNSTLVVDATGVGRAVVDIIRRSEIRAEVRPYSVTAGREEGDKTVPKKDVVGAVLAALQTRRLRFAESLELRGALEKELENYRVKVTANRNEVFESLRESDHDDLVMALALALWYGERTAGWPNASAWKPRFPKDPFHRLHPGTFQ